MHPPFFAIMDEIQDGLRYMFQTKSKYVCLISGTGHAGGSGGWPDYHFQMLLYVTMLNTVRRGVSLHAVDMHDDEVLHPAMRMNLPMS